MTPVFRVDRLRAYMDKWGMRPIDLANSIDVSRATVCHLLKGGSIPQMRTMWRIHRVTGLPYDYLVCDIDELKEEATANEMR